MKRIMGYYYPKWLAYTGLLVSTINGFAFPLYGLIYAKILFIMLVPQLPDFEEKRDFWCGMFLILVVGIGLFSFLQKYIFMYVGENLTFDIRNKLY
jgi:ABC-type multidrug transport system fused ATPase/permease subunit